MPNLILTTACNNHCPFCFVENRPGHSCFTLADIQALLPLLRSFKRDRIHLLGGEPTLNPDFIAILSFLLDEGFQVKIFSNGKLSKALISRLQMLSDGEFFFCINRSDGILTPEIVHFYQRSGFRIQLGFTIYDPFQSFVYIQNEIEKYHLMPQFRVGIALPIWPRHQNQYLHPEQYALVSQRLFTFLHQVIARGLKPEFDCGFPFCFFNAGQRDWLQAHAVDFRSQCGVIPDLRPDFSAIPCFPLGRLSVKIDPQSHWSTLHSRLREKVEELPKRALFAQCQDCEDFYAGSCCGGCKGFGEKEISYS